MNDNFKNDKWELNNNIVRYSKRNYGLQKGNKFTKNLEKIFKKNTLNFWILISLHVQMVILDHPIGIETPES